MAKKKNKLEDSRIGAITVICTIIGVIVAGGAIGGPIGAAAGFLLDNEHY